MSTHVNQQSQPHPTWIQIPAQKVPEPLHNTYPPSVMGAQGDVVTSTSHPPHHPGLYSTRLSSHVASDPSGSLWLFSSDGHMFPRHVSRDIHGPSNLGGPSAHPSPSHGTFSHYPIESIPNDQDVTTPPHFAHQPSTPSGPNWHSYPTLPGASETRLDFRFVPPQESSRHRQCARAIKYSGLWIDVDELVESLKELDGRVNVHQCLWEEDRFPCHLWVKTDKSSINVHIQRWHRGRPGGDKLKTSCRWSGCGSKMSKESISRHILGTHLKEMWVCQCEKRVTRKDAYARHVANSDFEGCRTAGPLITYAAQVRVIDARAALNSGGSLRYANT